YISKILDIEDDVHCGFQVIVWALGHGQDSFMYFQKEIHNNLKAKSELYRNQGFLDEINRFREYILTIGQSFTVVNLGVNHSSHGPPSQTTIQQSSKDENLFPAAKLEKNWEQMATPEAMQLKNRYWMCFELNQRLKFETSFYKCTFHL
ncbi:hypothetical protein VP01_9867g1, partial [Puccinia sorghi]